MKIHARKMFQTQIKWYTQYHIIGQKEQDEMGTDASAARVVAFAAFQVSAH